jgi:type I restriction enzyme S subunit
MSSREWRRYKFSDFVKINPTISLKGGGTFSFIEMKDLSEGKRYVLPSNEKEITGGARFKEGNTLFARITPCLENGKIGQAKNLKNGVGFGSTEFLIFDDVSEVSDKDFIYYLACWKEVRKFAEQNMVGTSGRQRVGKEAFEKLELAFPNLITQKRIAFILSTIDDKIENNLATNQTLEEIARTLFKEWFVNFNYPNAEGNLKHSEFGEIPESWSINGIGEICYVQNGYAFKSKDFLVQGEVGIIKIKNISGNVVDIQNTDFVDASVISSLDTKFKIESGSLLIAMTGAEVGKIGLVPLTEKNLWLNQRVGMFQEKIAYGNLFMYLLFSTATYQTAIQNSALGSAQPNISASAIESIRAIIPPAELIEAFGKAVKPMFEKILDNLAENETLKTTRDSLLPKLMSGEIEVNG